MEVPLFVSLVFLCFSYHKTMKDIMGNEMWRFIKCHWGLLISGSSYDTMGSKITIRSRVSRRFLRIIRTIRSRVSKRFLEGF